MDPSKTRAILRAKRSAAARRKHLETYLEFLSDLVVTTIDDCTELDWEEDRDYISKKLSGLEALLLQAMEGARTGGDGGVSVSVHAVLRGAPEDAHTIPLEAAIASLVHQLWYSEAYYRAFRA